MVCFKITRWCWRRCFTIPCSHLYLWGFWYNNLTALAPIINLLCLSALPSGVWRVCATSIPCCSRRRPCRYFRRECCFDGDSRQDCTWTVSGLSVLRARHDNIYLEWHTRSTVVAIVQLHNSLWKCLNQRWMIFKLQTNAFFTIRAKTPTA